MNQISMINQVRSWERNLEIENENRKNLRIPPESEYAKDVSVFEDMTQLFFERLSVRKNQARLDHLCCSQAFQQKTQVH
jgi:hypothetical protein